MNHIQLLNLALHALKEAPSMPVSGMLMAEAPFDKSFPTQALISKIEAWLQRNEGFTVILAYPDRTEDYSSTSHCDKWEDAVLEVASLMLESERLAEGSELEIVDVFEGTEGHETYHEVNRSFIVKVITPLKLELMDNCSNVVRTLDIDE